MCTCCHLHAAPRAACRRTPFGTPSRSFATIQVPLAKYDVTVDSVAFNGRGRHGAFDLRSTTTTGSTVIMKVCASFLADVSNTRVRLRLQGTEALPGP